MNITYTIDKVEEVANEIINQTTSKTILLYGDMGVGKTTLIKAIVNILGSNDVVSSPTFSIVNEYKLDNDKIFHFDLYRVNDLDEAYNFGIEDYLESNNWVIIEWPDIIQPILSGGEYIVNLSIQSEKIRQLIAK